MLLKEWEGLTRISMIRVQTFHYFPNLACVSSILKGRERGFWAREKHGGRVRKEERARSYPPFSLARGVSRLNSLPSPFERLPCRLAIIKLSYYHIFIFPANCYTFY